MRNKKCKNCGYPLKKDMITYKTEIWDKTIEIPFVEEYKCTECDYIEVDEKVKDRLNAKVLEKKLEMYKDGEVKILQINNIKEVRKAKGVAQGKIGEALDFTEQRFGAIERNDNTPTVYLAGVIAKLLGVDIYDLYQFEVVPMDVFLELENLDENFNEIEGLSEVRKEYYEALDIERNLRDEANELKVKRRRISKRINNKKKKLNETLDTKKKEELKKEIDKLSKEVDELDKKIEFYDGKVVEVKGRKRPKKIGGKLNEIQTKISKLLKQIRKLEKDGNAILKQGYCLTKEDWEKTKKYFGDRIK